LADTPELQNPFLMRDGSLVESVADWRRRRHEILDLLMATEYGRLPPVTEPTEAEELHRHEVARFADARHMQFRIRAGPGLRISLILDLLVPQYTPPLGVMLIGDTCWLPVSDVKTLAVLRRGYILAQFNRVEVAHDDCRADRTSGLYAAYPYMDFGAIAAWAWGFHRCVDFLCTCDFVDPRSIAAVGHSRGGKAALLAGATDERIGLTAPNGSGCGGAGSFLRLGPESEALRDILGAFPYWFAPGLKEYIGREESLGFDQHYLKALVAPRPLLSTEALGDLWANPSGTWQTFDAAREVYRFLGAVNRIGIHFRQGQHDHAPDDWTALLDFADWHFKGVVPVRRFDVHPFSELDHAFTWSAPSG
jgi:hypothetical protein